MQIDQNNLGGQGLPQNLEDKKPPTIEIGGKTFVVKIGGQTVTDQTVVNKMKNLFAKQFEGKLEQAVKDIHASKGAVPGTAVKIRFTNSGVNVSKGEETRSVAVQESPGGVEGKFGLHVERLRQLAHFVHTHGVTLRTGENAVTTLNTTLNTLLQKDGLIEAKTLRVNKESIKDIDIQKVSQALQDAKDPIVRDALNLIQAECKYNAFIKQQEEQVVLQEVVEEKVPQQKDLGEIQQQSVLVDEIILEGSDKKKTTTWEKQDVSDRSSTGSIKLGGHRNKDKIIEKNLIPQEEKKLSETELQEEIEKAAPWKKGEFQKKTDEKRSDRVPTLGNRTKNNQEMLNKLKKTAEQLEDIPSNLPPPPGQTVSQSGSVEGAGKPTEVKKKEFTVELSPLQKLVPKEKNKAILTALKEHITADDFSPMTQLVKARTTLTQQKVEVEEFLRKNTANLETNKKNLDKLTHKVEEGKIDEEIQKLEEQLAGRISETDMQFLQKCQKTSKLSDEQKVTLEKLIQRLNITQLPTGETIPGFVSKFFTEVLNRINNSDFQNQSVLIEGEQNKRKVSEMVSIIQDQFGISKDPNHEKLSSLYQQKDLVEQKKGLERQKASFEEKLTGINKNLEENFTELSTISPSLLEKEPNTGSTYFALHIEQLLQGGKEEVASPLIEQQIVLLQEMQSEAKKELNTPGKLPENVRAEISHLPERVRAKVKEKLQNSQIVNQDLIACIEDQDKKEAYSNLLGDIITDKTIRDQVVIHGHHIIPTKELFTRINEALSTPNITVIERSTLVDFCVEWITHNAEIKGFTDAKATLEQIGEKFSDINTALLKVKTPTVSVTITDGSQNCEELFLKLNDKKVVEQLADDLYSIGRSFQEAWNPDILSKKWQTNSKDHPNINAYSSFTNKLTDKLKEHILSSKSEEEVKTRIQGCIDLAKACIEKGDLNTAHVIHTVFGSPQVSKLRNFHNTTTVLEDVCKNKKYKEQIDKMELLFYYSSNYKNVRAYVQNNMKVVLPCAIFVAKDLFAVSDAGDPTNRTSCNMEKCNNIQKTQENLLRYSSPVTEKKPILSDIYTFIDTTTIKNDENFDLYQKSLEGRLVGRLPSSSKIQQGEDITQTSWKGMDTKEKARELASFGLQKTRAQQQYAQVIQNLSPSLEQFKITITLDSKTEIQLDERQQPKATKFDEIEQAINEKLTSANEEEGKQLTTLLNKVKTAKLYRLQVLKNEAGIVLMSAKKTPEKSKIDTYNTYKALEEYHQENVLEQKIF